MVSRNELDWDFGCKQVQIFSLFRIAYVMLVVAPSSFSVIGEFLLLLYVVEDVEDVFWCRNWKRMEIEGDVEDGGCFDSESLRTFYLNFQVQNLNLF